MSALHLTPEQYAKHQARVRSSVATCARDYCNAMLAATDPARRAQCYRLMIDAIMAKDGM